MSSKLTRDWLRCSSSLVKHFMLLIGRSATSLVYTHDHRWQHIFEHELFIAACVPSWTFYLCFFVLSAKQEIPDSAFCAMLQIPERIPLWELSTCLFFAVPMAVMVVLYGRMGMQIRSRTQRTLELGRLHMMVAVPQSHMFIHIAYISRTRFYAGMQEVIVFFFYFCLCLFPTGVRNGSVNGPSRVSQSRKAIIRMLGKSLLAALLQYTVKPYLWCNIISIYAEKVVW